MKLYVLLAIIAVLTAVDGAHAQNAAGAPGSLGNSTQSVTTSRDYMSQRDLSNLASLIVTKHLLEGPQLAPDVVKATGIALVKALHISCQLESAREVAVGRRKIDSKNEPVSIYEIVCGNGMGYLLTLTGRTMASGMSCFEASGVFKSNDSSIRCAASAGGGEKSIASAVLKAMGTACNAIRVKWLGHSASSPAYDYTDVACADGHEYVLHTPVPGASGKMNLLTCENAVKHGAHCGLTPDGMLSAEGKEAAQANSHPNLMWFEDEFTKNHFSCTVKNARLIGRELIKRRWVAEFQCVQHPRGVVVFVPSAKDTVHHFKRISCAEAVKRHLACEFPYKK